jgi:radical SAM protein with 4Fe4S-binding SPASM domain
MIMFETPARLRWFFNVRETERSLRTAMILAVSGILKLDLRISGLPDEDALMKLKDLFGRSGTRIAAEMETGGLCGNNIAALESLSPSSISLYINPSRDDVPDPGDVQSLLGGRVPVFLCAEYRRSHLEALLLLARRLPGFNFAGILLSNPFLAGPENPEIPSPEDLEVSVEDYEDRLAALSGNKIFYHPLAGRSSASRLKTGENFSGCQAANVRACVAWDGTVFPCESFPLPLGNLKSHSLREIWDLPARKELALKLAGTPAACAGCGILGTCLGGCRGLTYYSRGSIEERDMLCRRGFRD